jgi:hypothetical protein
MFAAELRVEARVECFSMACGGSCGWGSPSLVSSSAPVAHGALAAGPWNEGMETDRNVNLCMLGCWLQSS